MNFLARIELPSESGLAEDVFTNTLGIMGVDDEISDADLDQLAQDIPDFLFNQIPTGGLAAVATAISGEVDRAADAARCKLYDLTGKLGGGDLGSPTATGIWTVGPRTEVAGNPDLPAEVAVCITLEATGRAVAAVETDDGSDPGSERDRPMQRRTGRIFVGPLNGLALSVVGGQTRPSSYIRDTARLAVHELDNQLLATYGARIGVWSRVDATIRSLSAVSVDNAFDTIRSRGPAATGRIRSYV